MKLSGKNFIGNLESGKGKQTFLAKNPETLKDIETAFFEATGEEIDQAVLLARNAFDGYRSKSSEERALFLEAIAENILGLGDCIDKTLHAGNSTSGNTFDRRTDANSKPTEVICFGGS